LSFLCINKWNLVNRLAETRGWAIQRTCNTHTSSSSSHGEIRSHLRLCSHLFGVRTCLHLFGVRTCLHLFRVEIMHFLEIQDRREYGGSTQMWIHGTLKEKIDWKLELLRNIAQLVPIGMCTSVHFIFWDASGDV
jgi:hypothetical protein